MKTHIKSVNKTTALLTTLVADSGIVNYSDEPVSNGGTGNGFTPHELLAAALAACTSITLKMVAARKGWNIENMEVDVYLENDKQKNNTVFNCEITLPKEMMEEQKNRLMQIAGQCPIHKILSGSMQINTKLL